MLMASKLIALAPYEAQNPLELSLREAYGRLLPQLTYPLRFTNSSAEVYLNLNRAILYGVLCEPNLVKSHIKYLHSIVIDRYCLFIKLLSEVVDCLYAKLLEFPRVQVIWVASLMIDISGKGIDCLLVSLLRQIVGGDFSDGNLWLSGEMVNLFSFNWDLILNQEPMVLTSALYTYLRLLADHYRLPDSPSSSALKQKEIDFCIRMLREQFHLCLRIGRDLIRLLLDLVHIPEFRDIWKDMVLIPGLFKIPEFSDISVVYGMRTSSRYALLRITPEMETQLRFLLTDVKLGAQKRHQTWFARKFLFAPERESLISDIVRFICCAHHPSNEVLHSDVTPRWALIGWLLKACTKRYIEANVKLALFYDWLFFDEKVDNVMNIEPAMLLMVNSIPRYIDMTNSLLEFLLLLVDNYDTARKNVILKGVSSALSMLVRSRVIESLDVFTSCNSLSPSVKEMLRNMMLRVRSGINREPQPTEHLSCSVSSQTLPNPPIVESQTPLSAGRVACPRNVELIINPISKPRSVDSAASFGSSGVNTEGQGDDIAKGKIGGKVNRSNKMGQKIVEKIMLLSTNPDSYKNSVECSSEFVACDVKKELELTGYKLFSHHKDPPKSVDDDDEVDSVTASVIRIFIFSQHPQLKEMLLYWSTNGCLVRARLLSYALRLAYEAHVGGHVESLKSEINYDKMMPLLKFHVAHYFAFVSGNGDDVNGTIASASRVDEKLISKMIDDAFSAYRIMVTLTSDVLSGGKLLSIDVKSCSLWKIQKFKVLFHSIFSYLSDLALGDWNVILLLVSELQHTDLLSIQIDVGLKRFAIFGQNFQNIWELIRRSVHWEQVKQHKLWGLIRSELSISEFPVEKLLLDCFFSDDLDPKASGVVIGGLMTLCSCRAPTPEIVGALMLLPNNKFSDFSAAVLSHWVTTNASMLINSIANFLDKLEKKNEYIALDWNGIAINKSAVLFMLKYLEAQGTDCSDKLDKLALNLSDIKTRLENSVAAMEV